MKNFLLRTILLGITVSAASCSPEQTSSAPAPEQVPSMSSVGQEKTKTVGAALRSRRTTSPAIAVNNLNAQIVAMQKRVERMPGNMAARKGLIDLLLNRTKFLGSYDDFDTALAVAMEASKYSSATGSVALLHAKVLSALHRFDEALVEIAVAEKLGTKGTKSARESIELARGDEASGIVAKRSEAAALAPSFASLTALASSLSSAGSYAKADTAYVEAKQGYRDVSPFPLAWVSFQRGMMWGEMADNPDKAYDLYKEAVERLPQYIVGNVHLAELEHERGEHAQAIARLESIVDTTGDPEPASRLAEMLRESDPQRADKYAKRAGEGYESLLRRFPLAFADHATEYYLGEGKDPKRALSLAMMNLNNRHTERAYDLALRAAHAAGDDTLAASLSVR